ncbi:hypothetical protein NW762_010684 [Fusarium torreyae]|uniref:Uncharacterized protein n=1 Tax=Fusarium torreyae TaxID=1237075 RepID=A0A9W8RQS9_9HYPO|nr:hypothetical protein NW762_010684 [Fusarium torreyae]
MEVIPVPWIDQPTPVPNLRTRTFFIADHLVDGDALKNGLDQLIRNHWRKLGSRLVSSRENRQLEYHLPHQFEDDYTLFKWSTSTKDQSIRDNDVLSKIVSPGDGLAFLPSMDDVDKLLRPSDWPFERKDEPSNSPLLYVHLTFFNDAAVVALSCPHTLADQSGVANIVKAWLAVVEGKPPPKMVGYTDDVLGHERFSKASAEMGDRKGRMRIRGKKDQALVVARIALDILTEKEESHAVFLPVELVHRLREKARNAFTNNDKLAKDISNGDVITAIFTKFARMHATSNYNISLSQTINLRGRIPELEAEKGDGYIHNALHYATTNFAVSPSTPLHEIALQNRKSVTKALEPTDIEAGVSTLRELAKYGQVMLICEPHHKLYAASNWCGAWQGIDFSKAAPKSYTAKNEKKELLVIGQSKVARSPGRYRVSIMCRTKEGFWCDFAAPLKALVLVREHLAKDPWLESL